MNIKYIDLVLENCDVVRLEPKDVSRFHISGITEGIDYYGTYKGTSSISRTRHCTYFGILIDKPMEIPQVGFAYPDNTNAYEMITAYSDITAIDIIYENDANEYIYVDFNEYNDNYNINQKNDYYNNMLEITITESNSKEEEDE
ncbi:hypothetical protein QCF18_09985 [Staphylococcus aureus]|jgi:hypothetical protein|uniref:ORF2 n=27 Tax=Kayvirus TaxID=1857843 RepID=Q6Y7W4_BPPGK|nr:hypothetical protein [Staphylococcus aureus]YP_008873529.1 hypothetical protein X920_gp009 [Staphylococcus phage Sb1]YP_009041248.1 hypothetical protein CPT_phageK_gp026 [Staphylococcus phage K]YP_009098161.1 hypothetical protein QLX38_gp027 [Staphylococcus phage Team1]YP_009224437.1 hypothetical protein ST812_027 [Staphylococcus phage 812]YP_009780221.1 hypothetical protein QLX23_gp160 [Staphylococcus phage ISP]YP_009780359.1 hypothetical protein QLX37_gp086 [Staphylococcus phage SA5]YP_